MIFKSKVIGLEILVKETVADKVDQVRAHCLGAFCFQKLSQMIVCSRKEFYQDLSYDSYPGSAFSGNRDHIKLVNKITAHFLNWLWLMLPP